MGGILCLESAPLSNVEAERPLGSDSTVDIFVVRGAWINDLESKIT